MRPQTIFLTIVILITGHILCAQGVMNVQEDTIRADTTWDADTVKVYGNITVMDSVRLTISPGTCVEFQDYYAIYVHGYLTAVASGEDTITFTSVPEPDAGWYGILFLEGSNHTDTSKIIG